VPRAIGRASLATFCAIWLVGPGMATGHAPSSGAAARGGLVALGGASYGRAHGAAALSFPIRPGGAFARRGPAATAPGVAPASAAHPERAMANRPVPAAQDALRDASTAHRTAVRANGPVGAIDHHHGPATPDRSRAAMATGSPEKALRR